MLLNTFLLLLGILPALPSSGPWECEDAKAWTCLALKYLTSCLSIFTPLVLARLYITCASFIACHKRGGWNNQPVQLFAWRCPSETKLQESKQWHSEQEKHRIRKLYLFLVQFSSAVKWIYCLTPNSCFPPSSAVSRKTFWQGSLFDVLTLTQTRMKQAMVTKSSMLIKTATELKQLTMDVWWVISSRRWSSEPKACRRESESLRGTQALPHLPLVQWGYGYPIGAVKVWHQHLQNVLNLQEAKEKGKEKWLREGQRENVNPRQPRNSLTQLVRTTHLSPAALGTPRTPSDRLWCQQHLPEQSAANYCSTLHTVPAPLSFYPSTTVSSSSQIVQQTKEEGGGKWLEKKNETLTFSGGCWSSVVGVAGLLPSLVLRFFLVPAVAPGLFFCWYSFSCEEKKKNLKSKQNTPKSPLKT